MNRGVHPHPFLPVVVLVSSLAFTLTAAGFAARAAQSRETTSFQAVVDHSIARVESRIQLSRRGSVDDRANDHVGRARMAPSLLCFAGFLTTHRARGRARRGDLWRAD